MRIEGYVSVHNSLRLECEVVSETLEIESYYIDAYDE